MSDNFQTWLQEQIEPRQLLLVDDSTKDCDLIQGLTGRFNCTWLVCHDIQSALRRLEDKMADVKIIFLDLVLGSAGSGVSAYQELKGKYRSIPIVVLSGALDVISISKISSFGFALFCQKPACFTEQFFSEMFQILNIPEKPPQKV